MTNDSMAAILRKRAELVEMLRRDIEAGHELTPERAASRCLSRLGFDAERNTELEAALCADGIHEANVACCPEREQQLRELEMSERYKAWKDTLSDYDQWAHCGDRSPHTAHPHDVTMNEGTYKDVQCVGTPNLHKVEYPGTMGGDKLYTLEQARKILAREECTEDGHDLDQNVMVGWNVNSGNSDTREVLYCGRCHTTFVEKR